MASSSPTFPRSLRAGLQAGLISAGANLAYFFLYKAFSGMSDTGLIQPLSTVISSILPVLLASAGWFGLTRLLPKQASVVFTSVVVTLALMSLGSSFETQMPDGSTAPEGFAWLSAPMHLVAGAAALLIPRFAPMK